MTTLNTSYIENLFLSAEELLNENKAPEAKELLLEILMEEPGYGKAHALLAYIYTFSIVDLLQAERHYKLALKFCSGYPVLISNYTIFLLEANKLEDLLLFVDERMNEVGVDVALLIALKGNALEVMGRYRAAMKLYKEAKQLALNTDFIHNMNRHIDRLTLKMNRMERVMAAL